MTFLLGAKVQQKWERKKYLHVKDLCAFHLEIQHGMNLGKNEAPHSC